MSATVEAGEGRASFALKTHNPDVLTCIADLSNDEVFTPPELANQMLDALADAWIEAHDGASIWADSSVTFLDPFTKSGVFLREIVARLVAGLEGQIPDLQERVDHILTKQIFGIGITSLTALLARRSVYCSKDATGQHSIARAFNRDWGNIWFERTEHTWAGDKCVYCGARRAGYERDEDLETHAYAFIHASEIKSRITRMFGADMQFDVIIGNPPYQLSTGGGTATQQASPLYHRFVKQGIALGPRFLVMVTPSRWFSGGMPALNTFRSEMLADRRMKELVDFPDSRDAFVGVDIAGGVNYFVWDQGHDGPCRVATVMGEMVSVAVRELDQFDVFVRSNLAIEVIEKIRQAISFSPFTNWVSAVSPFGLSTSFRGAEVPDGLNEPIVVRSTGGRQFIAREDVAKNLPWIDHWKVLLSATSSEHAGQADRSGLKRVFSRIEPLEPGTVVTHSYLTVGPVSSASEAENVASYLCTRFVRFLVSQLVTTQHISRANFAFVPVQDFSQSWTDEALYAKYGLTEEEIAFIESHIKPMDFGNA